MIFTLGNQPQGEEAIGGTGELPQASEQQPEAESSHLSTSSQSEPLMSSAGLANETVSDDVTPSVGGLTQRMPTEQPSCSFQVDLSGESFQSNTSGSAIKETSATFSFISQKTEGTTSTCAPMNDINSLPNNSFDAAPSTGQSEHSLESSSTLSENTAEGELESSLGDAKTVEPAPIEGVTMSDITHSILEAQPVINLQYSGESSTSGLVTVDFPGEERLKCLDQNRQVSGHELETSRQTESRSEYAEGCLCATATDETATCTDGATTHESQMDVDRTPTKIIVVDSETMQDSCLGNQSENENKMEAEKGNVDTDRVSNQKRTQKETVESVRLETRGTAPMEVTQKSSEVTENSSVVAQHISESEDGANQQLNEASQQLLDKGAGPSEGTEQEVARSSKVTEQEAAGTHEATQESEVLEQESAWSTEASQGSSEVTEQEVAGSSGAADIKVETDITRIKEEMTHAALGRFVACRIHAENV